MAMLLLSCAPESAWDEDQPPAPVKSSATLLNVSVVPQTEMNHYLVKIVWNAPAGAKPTHIQRRSAKGDVTSFAIELKSGEQTVSDDKVEAGISYTYSLNESDVSHSSVSVDIPRDVLIEETGPISSLTIKGRLYVKRDVTLFTNGEP
ncbi:hypothetical protein K2X33_14850, partial [bacterium]|nr:hypothetical protein [bacterium]